MKRHFLACRVCGGVGCDCAKSTDATAERLLTLNANFYGTRRYTGTPLTFDGWSFTQEGLHEFVRAIRCGQFPDRSKDHIND